MADHGTRYRIVTKQGGTEHISSAVLNREEAEQMLDTEAEMHELTEWSVARGKGIVTARILVGGKRVKRTITMRAYSPLDDIVQT